MSMLETEVEKRKRRTQKKETLSIKKKVEKRAQAISPTSGYVEINGNGINLIYLRISAS